MELPARPRFLAATHIPRSVNGKIFIAVIAADQHGSLKQQLMLCSAMLHRETLNIFTHSKQCDCHVPVDYPLLFPYPPLSARRSEMCRFHTQTHLIRKGCWFRRKGKQRMENRRKKEVRRIQHIWLWMRHNPTVASSTVPGTFCVFKMSAVISSGVVRLHNQAPDAFRGEALGQHTPPSLICLQTQTHVRFVQHWNNMRQRQRWGFTRTATVQQFSTNAELMGGGSKKKKKIQLQSWEGDFED